MNTTRVISELQEKYPGKKIVQNGKTEIVCEIEPGKAIAVIDKSAVHYHKITTETYKVISGELTLFLNGKKKVLYTGDECRIDPWTIHWAEGHTVWTEVRATPAWTPDDHILVGKEEQIHIVPYDPSWPDTFEKEKELIERTLGQWIVGGVHHVGSTSVPGLAAKPIIDIMVGVKNLEKAKSCIDLLANIQYQYFPYRPDIMRWFCKPSLEHRTHHLYLMKPHSRTWKERLVFRDALRTDLKTRQVYETLKRKLATKFKDDREAYTNAKEEFIQSVVDKTLKDI